MRPRGYSLVELLVAVSLGTVLLAGAALMMQLSHRSFRAASAEAQAVRDALRMAGIAERLLESARGVAVAERDQIVFWRARALAPVVEYSADPPQLRVHPLDGALPAPPLHFYDDGLRPLLLAAEPGTTLLLTAPLDPPPSARAAVVSVEQVRLSFVDDQLQIARCAGRRCDDFGQLESSAVGAAAGGRLRYFSAEGELTAPVQDPSVIVRVELELEHEEIPVVAAAPIARGGP